MRLKPSVNKKKLGLFSAAFICALLFTFFFFDGKFLTRFEKTTQSQNSAAISGSACGDDYIKILDVGQGDSILIYSNGYSALLDTGTDDTAAEVFADLDSAGIKRIDTMMITHYHDDHDGAADEIAEKYKTDNLILPKATLKNQADYSTDKAKQKVVSEGGNVYSAVQGMNFKIGDFKITVLACYPELSDENDRSGFIMAEKDGIKFLFTGDAGTKAESKLLKEGLNLDCDVLKVGHHGSNTSTTQELLKATTPEYAAISVGKNNMYSHPGKRTLASLQKSGAKILRTDDDGDIYFYVENGKLKTKTEK